MSIIERLRELRDDAKVSARRSQDQVDYGPKRDPNPEGFHAMRYSEIAVGLTLAIVALVALGVK